MLTATRDLADYFEAAARAHPAHPKGVANWVMTEVLRELKERRVEVAAALPAERLAALVALVDAGTISGSAAKQVFAAAWESGEEPAAVVERLGLAQVSDEGRLAAWVSSAIAEHPVQAADFRAGKDRLLGFFVGQVMKRSGGRAEPRRVRELVREALEREALAESKA